MQQLQQLTSLGASLQNSPKSNVKRSQRDQTSNLLNFLQNGTPSNKSISNSVASLTQMKAIFSNRGPSNENRFKKNKSTKFLPSVIFPSATQRNNSGIRDLSISRDNEDIQKISTKRIVVNQSANIVWKQRSIGNEQFSILSGSTNYNSPKLPQLEKSRDVSQSDNPLRILKYSRRLTKLSETLPSSDPSSQKAQLCHKILSLLSMEDGKYQNEMRILVEEIEKSIYCQSSQLTERINKLSSSILNQTEITTIPYFEITKNLVSYFETERQTYLDQLAEKDDRIDKLQQEKMDVNIQLENLRNERDELIAERDRNGENIASELNHTITKIQQERDAIYKEFMNIKANIEDAQTNFDQTIADEYVQHIKTLATEKLSIEDELSKKTSDLDNLKASHLELIDSYRKSIVKLKFSREQINKMEDQIKQLGIDNAKLAVRAATGFDQLTPRPNLNPIFEYFDVKPGNYIGTKEKVQLITKALNQKEAKPKENLKKKSFS